MAVGQHDVHASESIPVPTWTRPQADQSIPVQKLVHRAGKSIIQTLLRRAFFSYLVYLAVTGNTSTKVNVVDAERVT